jgi:hypothetical protein
VRNHFSSEWAALLLCLAICSCHHCLRCIYNEHAASPTLHSSSAQHRLYSCAWLTALAEICLLQRKPTGPATLWERLMVPPSRRPEDVPVAHLPPLILLKW